MKGKLPSALCANLIVLVFPVWTIIAQTWTQASAPITNWSAVTVSADARKMSATVYAGGIYSSTNSGDDWFLTGAPIANWQAIACSADGRYLTAAVNGGGIYLSSDSGRTWVPSSAPKTNWYCVGSSANGHTLVAAVGAVPIPWSGTYASGLVFVSNDSGTNWTDAGLPNQQWTSVTCSADGSRLVAAAFTEGGPSQVYFFVDSGTTWIAASFPLPYLSSVGASPDGRQVRAVMWDVVHSCLVRPCLGSGVFSTTNSGATWETISGLGPAPIFLAASADGRRWVSAGGALSGGPGTLATSTDSGNTWVSNNVPAANWSGVASSADGSCLVAVINGGGLWIARATPTPELSIARNGNSLLLSWILPTTDFALQETSDLTTENWTGAPADPTLNLTNLQYQVILPMGASNVFYRLEH